MKFNLKVLWIVALIALALPVTVRAQGCGAQNPGCIVPTAPIGTSTNQAASTAFVNSEVAYLAGLRETNVTGASTVFTAAQAGYQVNMSNSGAPMTGTLPGTSPGVLPVRTTIVVANADTVAPLQVTAGAGAVLFGAPDSAAFVLLGPGQSATFASDGSNYFVSGAPARAKANRLVLGTVTGSITGTTLTAASSLAGTLAPGQMLGGGTVKIGTTIVSQLSGTPGGLGDYQVSTSQTAGSATIAFGFPTTLYFAASGGSDANSGITPQIPFATPQGAIDGAYTHFDLNEGFFVFQACQAAGATCGAPSVPQTFAGFLMRGRPPGLGNATGYNPFYHAILIRGDTVTPANYTINAAGTCAQAIQASFFIDGFKLVCGGDGVSAISNSIVGIGSMEYGAMTSGANMAASFYSQIHFDNDTKVSGNAQRHKYAFSGGAIQNQGGTLTTTLVGTPTFSVATVDAQSNGIIVDGATTYSGAAHGKRWNTGPYVGAISNTTAGTCDGAFPGDSGGANSGGGQCNTAATTYSDLTLTGSFTAPGLVTNADLANPSVTVGGTTCTLGSSCTPPTSLVVGSSAISGGTSTRVLFDNAGTLGEYVISGSGNVAMTSGATLSPATINAFTLGGTIAGGGNQINNVVIGTSSPLAGSFTTASASTSVTSPIHYGGSAAGSSLTLQSTSGAGTTDSISLLVGNNGATKGMKILTSGKIGLGPEINPQYPLVVSGNTSIATGATVTSYTPVFYGMAADGTSGDLIFDTYQTGGGGNIVSRAANGTGAAPTATQSGDQLAFYEGLGYGTSFVKARAAGFRVTATENWSGTNSGSQLEFWATMTGGSSRSNVGIVDGKGHVNLLNNGGTLPVISACGTSPSVARGGDTFGEVTEGTTATGCIITFANSGYATAPYCVVTSQAALSSFAYTISTTAITISHGSASSTKIDWHCGGT